MAEWVDAQEKSWGTLRRRLSLNSKPTMVVGSNAVIDYKHVTGSNPSPPCQEGGIDKWLIHTPP
ncbi:hypothetical protein AC477_02820 [miscellaneous Crenarchaeota group-1 archaeon SG8-32-1]|uniref:Uncharacterized protein n=1 Tax=miscellaneous Crenarchaeota group-1 archaeon SG8-32-1 TaxID=1685124 RepID=A0A0M0BVR9_9ARCH|nr:MAG: hypothetical protein AC477_02820 [miscellaneous Crenarchaeota group-1 archaeon SG8-32-1]